MRKTKGVALRLVPMSEIERLKEAGFRPLTEGDAGKACSDYFMVMVRDAGGGRETQIICPSFLRGPLGINHDGSSFSY